MAEESRPSRNTGKASSTSRQTPSRAATRRDPRQRYLVATSQRELLEQDEDCRLVRTSQDLTVAEMTPAHAMYLASCGIHAEPEQPVTVTGHPPLSTRTVTVEATDDAGRPVELAAVTLLTTDGPVTGYAGQDGRCALTIPAGSDADMVIVRPPRGCWPARLRRPDLTKAVQVTCRRVTTTEPDFPDRALDSWGTRACGFWRLPPTYRGSGVRIALIDSGAATGHPDLTGQLHHGRDIRSQDQKSWQEDLLGTGTHYATLLAGHDDGTGITGLVPEAELHILRVLPGGGTADLIEALDYCVAHQVDVAMFGAGLAGYSPLLAAKAADAYRAGVACVAAAGQDDIPGVLGVTAVGQLGTFPPDSTDTGTLTGPVTPEGLFVPEVRNADCCAPGVAVIGGLPPASYGPLTAPGAAAAHVTALAALILAHHPMFRREPGELRPARDASRPARLFTLIRAACRPLITADGGVLPGTGAGLPDAAVALGVAPRGGFGPLPPRYAPLAPDGRASLAPLTAAMSAAGLLPS